MTGAKECSLAEEVSPVFVINGSLFVTLLLGLLSSSIIQRVLCENTNFRLHNIFGDGKRRGVSATSNNRSSLSPLNAFE